MPENVHHRDLSQPETFSHALDYRYESFDIGCVTRPHLAANRSPSAGLEFIEQRHLSVEMLRNRNRIASIASLIAPWPKSESFGNMPARMSFLRTLFSRLKLRP
jgi:hypothetical protein